MILKFWALSIRLSIVWHLSISLSFYLFMFMVSTLLKFGLLPDLETCLRLMADEPKWYTSSFLWLNLIKFLKNFWWINFQWWDRNFNINRNLNKFDIQYLHLCFKHKQKSIGFGLKWEWVNYDIILNLTKW